MQQPRRADRRSVTVKCLSTSTLDPRADQDAWMYPPPWGGATPSHRSEGDGPGLGAFARDSWNLRDAHIYPLLGRNKGPCAHSSPSSSALCRRSRYATVTVDGRRVQPSLSSVWILGTRPRMTSEIIYLRSDRRRHEAHRPARFRRPVVGRLRLDARCRLPRPASGGRPRDPRELGGRPGRLSDVEQPASRLDLDPLRPAISARQQGQPRGRATDRNGHGQGPLSRHLHRRARVRQLLFAQRARDLPAEPRHQGLDRGRGPDARGRNL
ncbi:hypothetical protein D3C73_1016920 [compost metagenome]